MKTIKNANSMRTIIRLVSAILLMLVGVGNAWGDTSGTIYFGNNGTKINSSSVNGNDNQSKTWYVTTTGTSSYTQSTDYSQVGSSSYPATSIEFSMTLAATQKITAFSAKFGGFSDTEGDISIKVGSTEIGSGSLSGSSDVTVSNSSQAVGTTLTVTVTNIKKGVKCYYISYTYTAATAQTVTFEKEGGTFDDPSVFTNTNQITEASAGAGITLPLVNPSAACAAEGWGFYGWKTSSAVSSETTTAPTIVGKAGDTYYPAGATTLYAVFAKGEFTKETSTITAGGKYLIVANSGGDNYVMTNIYDTYEESSKTYGKLKGWQVDETNTTTHTYSAADINADYVFSIVTSSSLSIASGDWMIENVADNYYLSPDYQEFYLDIDGQDPDGNTISAGSSSGTWNIINVYSSNANRVYFDSSDKFFKKTNSTPSDLLIYKETTTSSYWSSPECCDKIVEVSAGTKTHVSTIAFDITDVPTCGIGDDDRKVTITVTPSSGYTLNSTSRLEYSGDGTAAYVSGPTDNGNGTYNFVYQFEVDDDGSGSFAATAGRFTNYKTVCCDDPELEFVYTGVATAEELVRENKARLDEADDVVLTYATSSAGTIITPTAANVFKLASYGNRNTTGGSPVSAQIDAISINTDDKKITLSIKTTSSGGNTGCGTYRVDLTQEAYNSGGDNYCEKTAYGFVDVKIKYEFIDAVNGNTTVIKYNTGEGVLFPTEGELSGGTDCHSETRVLKGWISETKLSSLYGGSNTRVLTLDDVKDAANTIVAPGADGKGIYAQGTKWYAVWAYEK